MRSLPIQKIFVLLLVFLPFPMLSQTLEQIMEKHIEAHGGIDKWSEVEALKISGNFTAFSEVRKFISYKKRDASYYADFYIGEQNIREAYDGENGWIIDPWQDIFHARPMSEAEKYVMKQKAIFFTPFYKYKEKGLEVEYKGKEEMDGLELFSLAVKYPSGKMEQWYLDSETYLEYMCISDWVDFAWPTQSEVYFDDFRTVEGLVLPFYTERTFLQRNHVLEIEEVLINPEVDYKLWEMPMKKEMEKLAFLEGEWDVKVETMSRRGSMVEVGSSSSIIQFKGAGRIEENFNYEKILPFNLILNYSYHDPSDSYRVSIYNELYASLDVYEAELSDSSFVFDDVNLFFKSEDNHKRITYRYEISQISDEGFIMTVSSSNDLGINWRPVDKFSYTRKKNKP